jgi:hypothetical protein
MYMPNNLNDDVICKENCIGCEHAVQHKYMTVDSSCDGGGDNNCPPCHCIGRPMMALCSTCKSGASGCWPEYPNATKCQDYREKTCYTCGKLATKCQCKKEEK